MGEHMMFNPPVSVHSTGWDDDTPLHVACVWGDLTAIDLLLAGGADVNARGDLGCTPIYNAVSFERVRSVERLLRAGATVDDPNELSCTARQRAPKQEPSLRGVLSVRSNPTLHPTCISQLRRLPQASELKRWAT